MYNSGWSDDWARPKKRNSGLRNAVLPVLFALVVTAVVALLAIR
jgi:multisubunit Na+/H+ antiporter MnhC subunit